MAHSIPSEKRVPVYGISLPADLDKAVREKARAEGRSMKAVIIELLWKGLRV